MLQGYSCVEPEILAIFGVIPLCLLFDRKKGTVCRAGLDRRVQSKCLVAELLEGAESSAHCCGFFSVTSDKNLFLVWEATPAAPEPMQAGEMKRLQLHEEKKINLVCWDSTPAATHRMKSGVLWSATNNAERYIVHAQPSQQWFQSHKRSLKLMGGCDRLRKKHHRVKHLTTSLRIFKLLANASLKDRADAKEQT